MKKTIITILFLSILIPNSKIKSLILPGWGEISSNNASRGRIFMYAESILMISAYAFNDLSNSYQSDYMAYARNHAGVDLRNKDYMFALDVGNNDNITGFNDTKERRRALIMSLDSNGDVIREYNHEIYPEGIQYDWDWDTDSNRRKFNSMRLRSINYEKYAGFALAGMLLNRIISFIDVMILDRDSNAKMTSFVVPKGYDGLELQLYIKF